MKIGQEIKLVALNLYCKIPFNRVVSSHPDIIRIADIIGRSPNSVKMKIGNFGSFDPELKKRGIVGLSNASKLDETVWNEFNNDWENLAFKSEELISNFSNVPLEKSAHIDLDDLPLGRERETVIRARVNQSFFRATILSSYNLKCCVTGLSIPDFLVASHIVPWSVDEKIRLNPHNGLCINSIHDRAYDKGFITVTTDFKIKVSKYLNDYQREPAVLDFFIKYEDQPITLPDKFLPEKAFLEYHNEHIFRK